VDAYGARRLVAAVIERAVFDRRRAVAQGILDSRARPCCTLTAKQAEQIMFLECFFYSGGLEVALEAAEFDIPIEAIRRKSSEPEDGRERE